MRVCPDCGARYNAEAFAVCPRCKPMVFEFYGHGFGENCEATVTGKTLGDVVDKTLKAMDWEQERVHGFKLEVDGTVIKLKRRKA